MNEREAFEAEYSKCDFGIEGHNFKKNPDGSYESQQIYTAFHWFKKGAALASQAQQQTQEPIAWMNPYGGLLHVRETGLEKATFTIPLYLQSQAQQPTEVKPYGYVTTLRNGTKHFYESMPYLDNAVKCDTVYLQSQAQQQTKIPPDWEKNVSRMWQCVRKHDFDIPSDDLDLMRDILLKAQNASQAQQPPLSNIKTSDERFNEWLLHTDKSISAGSYGSTKMKEFRADEIKELRAILQSQAQQESKEIGDMRENGVNWYGKNPHAFPVGTKFIAIPPAPEGGEK